MVLALHYLTLTKRGLRKVLAVIRYGVFSITKLQNFVGNSKSSTMYIWVILLNPAIFG
jgi:hypothetical protein